MGMNALAPQEQLKVMNICPVPHHLWPAAHEPGDIAQGQGKAMGSKEPVLPWEAGTLGKV